MFRSNSLRILAAGLVAMAAVVLSEPNLQYHRISLASTQRKSQSLRHFGDTQELSKQALRKLDEDEESEEEIKEVDREENEEEEETPVEEPSEDEEESPEEEAPAESEDVEEEEEEEEEEVVEESKEEEVVEESEEETEEVTEEEASEEEELEEDQVVEIESEDEETSEEEEEEEDEEESVEEEEVDILQDETAQCEGESSVFFETHPAIMEAFGAVVGTEPYLEQLKTIDGTVLKLHLLFPQDPMAALGKACASAGGVWTMAGFEGLACVPSADFLAASGVVGDPPLTVSFFGNCHADAAACNNVGSFNLLRSSLETFGLSCDASVEGDDDALPPPNTDVPVEVVDEDVSDILDLLEGESSAGMAGNRATAWLAAMGALGMVAVAVAF